MRLDKYIVNSRIIDIQSSTLPGAFKELIAVCDLPKSVTSSDEELLQILLEREKTITSYLGEGVALPHTRIPIKNPYMLAIGRCPRGLKQLDVNGVESVNFIFLLFASENTKNYLNFLASLARYFQDQAAMAKLRESLALKDFQLEVRRFLAGESTKPLGKSTKFNKQILKEAAKIAKVANCSSIVVFGDTFAGGVEPELEFKGLNTVLVTQANASKTESQGVDAHLTVRSYSNSRLSQLKNAIFIGLTRNIFKYNDRLCCVGGIPSSNQFDSIVVIDIEKEFKSIINENKGILPASVRPEALERVIAIATEISFEGREGKPIGCLFVLGDSENVKTYSKPLILNPFHGYKEEDRNILNPFMDETIKELASIDGAFIISGKGVLESAGSLIHAPDYIHSVPGGYGSRHAAAAAISNATDCIAIVVSSSGQVTLFRKGEMLPLNEKGSQLNF